MDDKPKIDWNSADISEKANFIRTYICEDEGSNSNLLEDFELVDNLHYLMAQLDKKFPRGFRWRPDNGLLICYGSYDDPPTQIDCDKFEDGAWVILLRLAGVEVKY